MRSVCKRFSRHISDALNNILDTHFARAIRKYGENHFHVYPIEYVKTQKETNIREQFWIRFYDSTNNSNGYNETDAIYKCGGNTYKNKTDDEMNKIKNKIKDTKIGGLNPNARAVKLINVKTGEERVFQSQKECANYLNMSGHHPISRRCRGEIKKLINGIYNVEFYNE